uniref:Uncharacterized protein n=1 Tax=Arundo donax TaxID=35708 RepID=A0A0A9DNC1_ARUDO
MRKRTHLHTSQKQLNNHKQIRVVRHNLRGNSSNTLWARCGTKLGELNSSQRKGSDTGPTGELHGAG